MNWHKIDWVKVEEIEKYYFVNDLEFFKIMAKNANTKLDEDYNLPKNFKWEDGYHANFPREEKQYLCYNVEDDLFCIGVYDEEQDSSPCFWDEGLDNVFYPDYWAELVKPK